MKLLLLLLLCCPAAAPAQEGAPARAEAMDLEAVKNKIAVSLFFRGELADLILNSGEAGRLVDLENIHTHAEARGRLIVWVRRNPDKAAEMYLNLRGSAGKMHTAIETRQMTWEFNPAFLESIKKLGEAAANSSVSREELEIAARRLYGGPQEKGSAVVLAGGGAAGAGKALSAKDFAGFRLDRGALEAELARAAAWMESARGAARRPGAAQAYEAALAAYREFVVAASALKGRGAVTEEESLRLEALRAAFRAALGGLSLREKAAALAAAEKPLSSALSEPGAELLLADLRRLRGELEALAAGAGSGGAAQFSAAAVAAEERFAALYLCWTVYDSLLSLKRSASAGFSCLYDYAAWRYLDRFFPGAAYPKARAELAAAAAGLGRSLELAAAGDLPGALAGSDPEKLKAAAAVVRRSSAFNRAAQFFNWGLLFRPVELRQAPGGGRPKFAPAFTLAEIAARRPAGK